MDGTHTTKTIPTTMTQGALRATENYYWRLYGSTLELVQKSNMQVVHTFTNVLSVHVGMENDVLCCYPPSAGGSKIMYVYPDGAVLEIPSSAWLGRGNRQFGPLVTVADQYDAGQSRVYASYLGTIANLDSPVTKTSSQTMKITYTLTEA